MRLYLHLLLKGEMPEWSNGAVSKTVELLVGSGGSNPPLSAKIPLTMDYASIQENKTGYQK